MLKVEVRFKYTLTKSYETKILEFEDQKAFDTWYAKQIDDESYRKVLTFKIL